MSNFDRKPLLENLAENLVVPGYRLWDEENQLLVSTSEDFTSEVTTESLQALKSQWLSSRLAWKTVEPYNFGPINDLFFYNLVDVFPVSTFRIDESIQDFNGSESYVASLGNTQKGYGAIEYLLFSQSESETIALFQDENHQKYLVQLAEELKLISSMVLTEWEEGFATEFVENTGNDVGASITQYTNALIEHVEIIKNFKVETPLGLRSNEAPLPHLVESPFAEQSALLIATNMDAVERTFLGDAGQGLDDYLNELDASDSEGSNLSDEILEKIEECRDLATGIDNLSESVAVSDQDALDLLTALQELTTLIKADMMSQLGLIITFSSNDGD